MTKLREVAKLALESLRGYRRELDCSQPCDAERALEAELAQYDKDVQWLKERQEHWCKQKSLWERAAHPQCAQGCEFLAMEQRRNEREEGLKERGFE
jgi:hypothetical protein